MWEKEYIGFNIEYVLREEPCTDPYARFCGQTEAAASSDPIGELIKFWDHCGGDAGYKAFAQMIIVKKQQAANPAVGITNEAVQFFGLP